MTWHASKQKSRICKRRRDRTWSKRASLPQSLPATNWNPQARSQVDAFRAGSFFLRRRLLSPELPFGGSTRKTTSPLTMPKLKGIWTW